MKWIKVKGNDLPYDMQNVIIGKNNMTDAQERLARPYVVAGWYCNNKFYSWRTKKEIDATHWMPMPELKNG